MDSPNPHTGASPDLPTSPNVLRRKAAKPRRSLRSRIIGSPIHIAEAGHQTIGKAVGLAVFASDALSSTAYATEAIFLVLAAAGMGALSFSLPISLAIVFLLAIVTISYEQTIHAYSGGGGAYIVSRDNLGELPAETAGAALLTDYILTVAVSVSAGVFQLTSAFPALKPYGVALGVAFVLIIMLINLRGVKESGLAFAVPTYLFLVMMFITLGLGLVKLLSGSLGTVIDPPEMEMAGEAVAGVSLFLLLHAFSNGTTALTGVEAISNGITAFKEPRSRNAGLTLVAMSVILGIMFVGITFLAFHVGAVPSSAETGGESVISQLARTVFGGQNAGYLALIAATTLILIMAANTAFADFPRLSALLAADGFLPRQLTYRGSRLVFSRGIMLLSAVAILLIILFKANTNNLIPLYAIGVFMSFTLSQLGMARRWWKVGRLAPGEEKVETGSTLHHDPRWRMKLIVNGLGGVCTFVVMMVFAITKFHDGAWIVLVITPSLVLIFSIIHGHYRAIAADLSLDDFGAPPRMSRNRVLLPVSGVHRGTLKALHYARSLSTDVTAVHVARDEAEAAKVQRKWDIWGEGTRLVILESPYRVLHEPLVDYVREVAAARQPNEMVTVVVPQFVPTKFWHNALHSQTAQMLRWALLNEPGVAITDVPYVVGDRREVV